MFRRQRHGARAAATEPDVYAGGLAFSFSLGVLLQVLGCLLWHNWWPMLTAFMYVLVPMPMLFFGGMDSGAYGGSSLASGWVSCVLLRLLKLTTLYLQ